MTKRTLVLLYPGAISYEVMYAIECLGAYGKVDITTPENHNHTDSSGLRICPTVNFEDVCITDYQALLIPGGNPDSIMGSDQIASFIQKAHESSFFSNCFLSDITHPICSMLALRQKRTFCTLLSTILAVQSNKRAKSNSNSPQNQSSRYAN